MCGVSGSGKSTWIKNNKKENSIIISRDSIRFSLLTDNSSYFEKETLVFKIFINKINEAINSSIENIYVDATHLNEKSRNKLLDSILLQNVNIIPVNIIKDLDTCLKQNSNRTGIEYIPEHAIINMFNRFTPASDNEKHTYKEIINI